MENMYDDLPADVDPRTFEEFLDRSPSMDNTNDEDEEDFEADESEENNSQSSNHPPTTRLTIEPVFLDPSEIIRANNHVSSRHAGIERVDSGDMNFDQGAVEPSTSSSSRRKWKQNFVRDKISTPRNKQKSKEKSSSNPRKRKISDLFTPEEKKILAREVKKCPPIWDLTSNDHSNSNVLSKCWKKIATILNHSEIDCKSVWKSLRDSYRYREKNKIKIKASGSEGGDPIDKPSYEDSASDWEFSMDLAFLPDTAKKRKTITSFQATEVENEGNDTECGWSQGNYLYQPRNAASSSAFDDSVSQLASNVCELIEIQKSIVPQSSHQSQPPLVHHVALANIDRMLKNLPPNEVEDTLFEITNFVYEKIKSKRDCDV